MGLTLVGCVDDGDGSGDTGMETTSASGGASVTMTTIDSSTTIEDPSDSWGEATYGGPVTDTTSIGDWSTSTSATDTDGDTDTDTDTDTDGDTDTDTDGSSSSSTSG